MQNNVAIPTNPSENNLDAYVKSVSSSITKSSIGDTFQNVTALSQEQLATLYRGGTDIGYIQTKINLEKGKILPSAVTYKLPIIGINAVFGCADNAYSIHTSLYKNDNISSSFHLVVDKNDTAHMIAKTKSNHDNKVTYTDLDFFYGLFLADRKTNHRKELTWINSSDNVYLVAFLRSAPKVAPCEAVMIPDSDAAYLMIDSIRQFLRLNAT